MSKKSGGDTLHVKVGFTILQKFRKVCLEKYGRKSTDMLREIIHAFNDGRIKIVPTEGQANQSSDLYTK